MIEFSLDDSSATGTLVLSGSLTIQHAQLLKDALLRAVGEAKRVVLNMEAVEAVDLTALQLLCVVHRNLMQAGIPLEMEGAIPEIVTEVVRESGFVGCTGQTDTIGLWMGETN